MTNKQMSAVQIEVMNNHLSQEIENKDNIKTHKNKIAFRQDKLIRLIRESIKKYSALGFSFDLKDSIELACQVPNGLTHNFNAKPFEINLEQRNVEFSFLPHANQAGSISYRVERFNNGSPAFTYGELSWEKGGDSEESNWFLNVHSGAAYLKDILFDKKGIEMLLTNMYLL